MASEALGLCFGCFKVPAVDPSCPECGYHPDPDGFVSVLSPGMLLGEKYVVGKVLGKPGGFGVTYLGYDTLLQRAVAVKELMPRELVTRRPDGATIQPHSRDDKELFGQTLASFLNEARVIAKFSHPNLVRVMDFFEANGTAYFVMEYYSGQAVSEYLHKRKRALTGDEALEIMVPIIEALDEVHAEGILHRDIKPANIYLTAQGNPVLLDFGAARQSLGEQTRTLTSVLTPGFAPFEQYHGRGNQGPWTDVYGCAATTYLLVTGQVPPEAGARIEGEELVPPDVLAPGLDPVVSDGIVAGLALRVEDRPRTASGFARVLRGLAAPDATVQAQAPGDGEDVTRLASDATRFAPDETRLAPDETRLASDATRLASDATRLAPDSTRLAPDATRLASDATRPASDATRLAPDATRLASDATRLAPDETRVADDQTHLAPASTVATPSGEGTTQERAGRRQRMAIAALALLVITGVSIGIASTAPDQPTPEPPPTRVPVIVPPDPTPTAAPVIVPDPQPRVEPEPANPRPTRAEPPPPATGILVIVFGEFNGASVVENRVLRALVRVPGLNAIDATSLSLIRGDDGAVRAAVGGDFGALAQLSRDHGAEFLVVGQVEASADRSVGSFFSGSAVLDLKMYRVSTGALVDANIFRVGGGGTAAMLGQSALDARSQAAEAVADEAATAAVRWLRRARR